MSLISRFLILFLTLSITSEISLDEYSIDPFKVVLKEEGILEVIKSIKKVYGQDVAIISCEELAGNLKGNCRKLVTEYIAPSNPKPPKNYGENTINPVNSGKSSNSVGENNHKFTTELTKVIHIIKQSDEMNYKILRERLKNIKKNPNIIYSKILNRVKKLPTSSKKNIEKIKNLTKMLKK